jgi:hypothetical protein
MLGDILKTMLKRNLIGCQSEATLPWILRGVKQAAKDDWYALTDPTVESFIANLSRSTRSDELQAKTTSLLKRLPPKEVWRYEAIAPREEHRETFSDKKKLISKCVDDSSHKFGIKREFWILHRIPGWPLTKAEPYVSADMPGADFKDFQEEAVARAVHVKAKGRHPVPIFNCPNSLMHVMSSQAYYSIRVYVIQTAADSRQLNSIEKQLKKDMKAEP